MSILSALEATAGSGSSAAAYIVGAILLLIFFGAMLGLLAFGKGREHS